MEIRPATIDDYQTLTELEAEVQEIHVEGAPEIYKPNGVISKANYEELFNTPGNTIVLGFDDGQVVGYMHYEITERAESDFTYALRSLHVHALSIKQEHRRKGYGEGMMEYAMERAAEAGVDRVTLDVAGFNKAAYAFYERLGFTPVQIRMGKKPNSTI